MNTIGHSLLKLSLFAFGLLAIAMSSASAQERVIECSIHPEEEPVNGINEIRMSLRKPKQLDSVEISRWAMTSAARKETFAVYESSPSEFYWGEEEVISSNSSGQVSDSVALVRGTDSRGRASWAIVKKRSTLSGGAGCIPNEDRGCRLDSVEIERTDIVCSDSFDQLRSDPEAARRRGENDPWHRPH